MQLRFLLALPAIGGLLPMFGCAPPQRRHEPHMDMNRMCAMHQQMTAGKSPAEQQAAIEAYVTSMHGSANPEMVAMHREMMDAHCTGSKASPQTK